VILSTLVILQLHFEMCAGLYGHPVYQQIVPINFLVPQMELKNGEIKKIRIFCCIGYLPSGCAVMSKYFL